MGFRSIEEAQEAYNKLKAESAEKISVFENEIKTHKSEIEKITKRAEDAEKIANDAIEKVNAQPASDDVVVTIDKKKYQINFGVEGFTKVQLKEKSELLKKMVKNGSAALTLLD